MKQPIKNRIKKDALFQKETIKKRNSKKTKQPIKTDINFFINNKYKHIKAQDGFEVKTSSIEELFVLYLNKLKLDYVRQFKLGGFYYDFAIVKDGEIICLVEIDGDFYHSNPKFYPKDAFLYPNQKQQKNRDVVKNNVASLNGFVLLRFWEDDIKNNKKLIFETLKKRVG